MDFPKKFKPFPGQLINWAHPLTKGLVGCWLFNEGSGQRVKELIENYDDSRTARWTYGNDGTALKFGGLAEYIYRPMAGGYRPNDTEGSIVVSARCDDITNDRVLVSSSQELGINTWMMYLDHPGKVFACYSRGGGDKITSGANLDDDLWRQYVLTSNGTTWRMFIDGTEQAVTVAAGNNDGEWFADVAARDHLAIGGRYYDGPAWDSLFKGAISYVYIYNRPLSPEEVRQIYIQPYAFFQYEYLWISTITGYKGGILLMDHFNGGMLKNG